MTRICHIDDPCGGVGDKIVHRVRVKCAENVPMFHVSVYSPFSNAEVKGNYENVTSYNSAPVLLLILILFHNFLRIERSIYRTETDSVRTIEVVTKECFSSNIFFNFYGKEKLKENV